MEVAIKRAAAAICNSTAILVTAGAGMGVDSGLPDFRGTKGLWEVYPPLKERGLSLPEMVNFTLWGQGLAKSRILKRFCIDFFEKY